MTTPSSYNESERELCILSYQAAGLGELAMDALLRIRLQRALFEAEGYIVLTPPEGLFELNAEAEAAPSEPEGKA